jgi:hypothetical protein
MSTQRRSNLNIYDMIYSNSLYNKDEIRLNKNNVSISTIQSALKVAIDSKIIKYYSYDESETEHIIKLKFKTNKNNQY